MRFGLLHVVAVLLTSLFATPVVNAQLQGESLPSRELLSRYGLELEWSTNAILNPTRDKVDRLVLDEETVYIQSQNGFVTAIDSQTGQRRWAQIFGRIDTPQEPVVSNSNLVTITAGTDLFGVNKWTGVQLFELDMPQAAGTPPEMDDSRVYIGSVAGSMYAFDLSKIYTLYQENLLPQWSRQTMVWRHTTAKPIRHRPLLHQGRLTFASETGTLYCVEAETDKLVYQMETRDPVSAPIVAFEDTVFVATGDQRLYCMNATKGTINWVFVARGTIKSQPVVIGDLVYIHPDDGTLYCLDARTGRMLWNEPAAAKMIAKTPTYIISEDQLGNLLLLNIIETTQQETATDEAVETDGEELVSAVPALKDYSVEIVARLPLRNYSIRATNELTDRVYLCSKAGQVICLKERGEGYPKYYQNPDKRPIDPIFFDESMATDAPAGEEPAADAPTN